MSTDALYSSCIEETLQLYSSSTTQTTSEIIVPFRNVTYKYIYDHRGQNSMLNMILTGNNNHQNVVLTPNSIHSPENFASSVSNSVCHGDELFNLFERKFASKKPNDNHDLRVERHMLSLWTDFAKHGYAPFGSGPEVPFWPSYSVNKPVTYVIGKDIHVHSELEKTGSAYFWNRYIPSVIAQGASAPIQSNLNNDWSGREMEMINSSPDGSVAKLKIFAWSLLSLSIVLILMVITLTILLIYQRKKHTFQATGSSQYRVRETSARALRRAAANAAAAANASNHSSTKRSRATTISTSQLY